MLSSNVSIANGYLNLEYTGSSGSIVTTKPDDGASGHTGFQYTFGYAEARIDVPSSGNEIDNWQGWWQDGQNWPADGELDIMEGLSGSACYHFHNEGSDGTNEEPGNCASGNYYSGWHTYGALWQNGIVTYYYDGVDVGSISSGITSQPMYLILENSYDTENGGPQVSPADMLVQYVRVWQQ